MNATDAVRTFADAVMNLADVDTENGRDMHRALDRIEDAFAPLRALYPRADPPETIEVLCYACRGEDQDPECSVCEGDGTLVMIPAPRHMQTRQVVREVVQKTRRTTP